MDDRARFDVWASQWGGEMGLHHLDLDGLWLAWQEAVKQEREACAKLCDSLAVTPYLTDPADDCADAIRARSELGESSTDG